MYDFHIERTSGGYRVKHRDEPATTFLVARANGKIVYTCPDYKNAPVGVCDHIQELKEQADSANWPAVRKNQTARLLEHPFRPNQVKLKDGLAYVEGATVIQRLNDVLGTGNWSFQILEGPLQLENEALVKGRLRVRMNGKWITREDFGAHEYRRNRNTKQILFEGDTIKAAVTDCIKRCAHQLGVGPHLYSPDGSYQSFRITRPVSPKPNRNRHGSPGQPVSPNRAQSAVSTESRKSNGSG